MDKREQVILGLRDLYQKVGRLNRLTLKQLHREETESYSFSEIACVEYVGDHAGANGTKLAEALHMTRSALSKMTRKLMQKGLIERYQRQDNKKEIYFRLTEKGRGVYDTHADMHRRFIQRDQPVFAEMDEGEIDRILAFFAAYDRHLDGELEKLNPEEGPDN